MLLTHRCKDRIRVAGIFVSFRPVSIAPVWKDATGQRLDRELLQIVVWIAGIRVDPFLIRKDRDRENRCAVMLADTVDAGIQEPARNKTTFGRSISTEVERRERTNVLSPRLFILGFWSSRSYSAPHYRDTAG